MSVVVQEYGKYHYFDEERGIKITFKQLHAEKMYDIHAHINVLATLKQTDKPVGLYRGRTGVTSVSAQKSIATTIEQRIRGDEKKGIVGMETVFGTNSPVVTNDWGATVGEACEIQK